jgi:hypothetical protein
MEQLQVLLLTLKSAASEHTLQFTKAQEQLATAQSYNTLLKARFDYTVEEDAQYEASMLSAVAAMKVGGASGWVGA